MNRNWYECPNCHVRVHREMREIHLQGCQGEERKKISSLRKNNQLSKKRKDNFSPRSQCHIHKSSSSEGHSSSEDDFSFDSLDDDEYSSHDSSNSNGMETYTEDFDSDNDSFTEFIQRRGGDFIGYIDLGSSFLPYSEENSNIYIETINIEILGNNFQERSGFITFVMEFIRNMGMIFIIKKRGKIYPTTSSTD
jgi:hypothetical protein